MGDARREALALRAIVVSGRAALDKTTDEGERERIKTTITELLAGLEQQVILDGADPSILAALEEARRKVWE
jgi:hypothetical protein